MTHYAGHRASPPAGYSTWEEFYRERAANPQMFGGGTSMRPSYPTRFTELLATNPVTKFLVPGAERFLQKGQEPSIWDYGLGAVDVALPAIPVGLIAGRVKDVAKEPLKKGAVTIKEFLTDLFSTPFKGGRTKDGLPGRSKIYELIREASEKGKISDLAQGKSLGKTNIQEARGVWARDGSLDNWGRRPPAGGAKNLPLAETWDTGKGFRANVPEQRKFLKQLRTENYPQGYGDLVDDMTDKQVAKHLSSYKRFIISADRNDAYMRPLGSDHVSYNTSGQHVSASAELQRHAANMSEKDVRTAARGMAHNYIKRGGLERSDLDDATFDSLVNYLAANIRERNLQFATSAPLWQLGARGIYENNPILALQTHHGNPIKFGGSGIDLRNLFAVSGGLQQGGTHRLMHSVQPKVLEDFYTHLEGRHYNPFHEAALKTARQKEEPYSGFLNIVQETNPNLWDYNMRNAFEVFRDKKNIWNY